MKVMKFGGSSLGDSGRFILVAKILGNSNHNSVVVLSAMQGVTNQLIQAARTAAIGDPSYREILKQITLLHSQTLMELCGPEMNSSTDFIIPQMEELKDILHGIELLQECSPRTLDLVMSFGERLSCQIMDTYLNSIGLSSCYIDSRSIIRTDDTFNNANVLYNTTNSLIQQTFEQIRGIAIVTGFIASTEEGITTTLGRNGSDYTASILAAALCAEAVEIWTDVDGVLSADPRIVKEAFVIQELSLEEASEMAYFGAKVIHPFTLHPLVEKKIPCWIKNTFNPEFRGSRINCQEGTSDKSRTITAIASIDDVSLINIIGSGIMRHPSVTARIFTLFSRHQINIIMITQASSEHSISILCRAFEAKMIIPLLKADLNDLFETNYLKTIELAENLEIVAVIGDQMKGTAGISGKLFNALGQKGVNIQAIAQGSSERNISFVIASADRELAINTVHQTFFNDKEPS